MKVISIYGIIGSYGLEPPDIRKLLDEAAGEDIKVEINSPGGFVWDGLEIYHLFKNYSGNVHFHVMGLAASMASLIPLAGDRITAEEATVWMIHNPWGGIYGADYRDVEKYAKYMKAMAVMFAKEYSKKVGKSEKVIRQAMDDETYFFGAEAMDFGLVDEIILSESDDVEAREDAIIMAQLQIEECQSKMKTQNKKEDVEKIAAFLEIETLENNIENQPASAGIIKMEESSMKTLDQILAENPAIQIEIDTKMNEKFNAGFEAGKQEISAKVEMASKYFGSEYPAKIKEIAAEAILGKKSIETLEAVVAVHDMAIEQANIEAAAKEKAGDTPAEQPSAMAQTGVATTVEDIKTMAANDKGGIN